MTDTHVSLREIQLHEEQDLQSRAEEPAHPDDRHRRGDRRRPVSRLGAGDSSRRPGPATGLRLGSIAIFFIMRALGELLLYRPVAGSFASYAEEFIGPWAGFFTGWSYWFMWVVTGMAEITAVAVYVNYWFPDVPHWIPALITLGVLYGDQSHRRGLLRRVRVLVRDHQGGDDHRADRSSASPSSCSVSAISARRQVSPTCGRMAVFSPKEGWG